MIVETLGGLRDRYSLRLPIRVEPWTEAESQARKIRIARPDKKNFKGIDDLKRNKLRRIVQDPVK